MRYTNSEGHSASHDDDTIDERAGGRWRRSWAWPQRAGALAVAAGIVLLAAACGGAPSAGSGGSANTGGSASTGAPSAGSGGSSNTGGSRGSAQAQKNLAFAQCMRSDGVTDFPDPGSNGQFGKISAQLENQPHFGKAYSACKHLLPAGVSKEQQDLPQLLKFAQCMHAHGVPTYPEPDPNANPVIGNTAVNALHQAGVNPHSPVVQAAVHTCERLYPVGPS